MGNPLTQLREHGQSPWLDSIRRGLIQAGELQAMHVGDGLGGVTSNPAIFEKAIGGSNDYQEALQALVGQGFTDAEGLYEQLAIQDVRDAADLFAPLYEESQGRDGFVSLEVSPRLARDTGGTIAEARRLWSAVDRPNAMIKVPATPEGIPAVEALTSEGININVTLLFDRGMYQQAAEAFIRGLEHRVTAGKPVDHIASVASFFLSRIDAALDKAARAPVEKGDERGRRALEQVGHLGVANAKMAYQDHRAAFASERWRRLVERGAKSQWLLWASTGTKDPNLSDVHYIESLIGPGTVTTIPPGTYEAFRERGRVACTLDKDLDEAARVLESVEQAGVDLQRLSDELLEDGVKKFQDAYDRLLEAVEEAKKASPQPVAQSQ